MHARFPGLVLDGRLNNNKLKNNNNILRTGSKHFEMLKVLQPKLFLKHQSFPNRETEFQQRSQS